MLVFCPKCSDDTQARVVLVDDDKVIQDYWKTTLERHGYELEAFDNPDQFKMAARKYKSETHFFVDQEYDGRSLGLEFSEYLAEKGYENIYLVSGSPGVVKSESDRLKGILGNKTIPVDLIREKLVSRAGL